MSQALLRAICSGRSLDVAVWQSLKMATCCNALISDVLPHSQPAHDSWLHAKPAADALQTDLCLLQVRGQLWVPFVMIFMGALCIAAVGIFQNSVALGFSYGVCVSTLMMGTDLLAALAMVVVWELPLIFPIVYLIFFGFVDGVFFTANLTKIPLGNCCVSSSVLSACFCVAICYAFLFTVEEKRSQAASAEACCPCHAGGWFAVSVASGVMIFSLVFFVGNSIKRQYAADHKVSIWPKQLMCQVANVSSLLVQGSQAANALVSSPLLREG